MKRLGLYTGNLYDYDEPNLGECCRIITDEDAANKEFLEKQHLKDLLACLMCAGCPKKNEQMSD